MTIDASYYSNSRYHPWKIVGSIEEVNKLTEHGEWEMLRPSDDLKLFLLGQVIGAKKPATSEPERQQTPIERRIDTTVEVATAFEALKWRAFPNNKPGEWAFTNEAEVSTLLKDFLNGEMKEAGQGGLTVGQYHYKISGGDGKFLNRFKAPKEVIER